MVAPSTTSANVDAEPMCRIEPQADQQDEPKPEGTSDFMLENRDRIASTSTVLDSGTTTPKPKELPPLPYSLRDHKLSISIIWTLLFLDTAVLPVALFYPLWYATDEPPWEVITITSCIFGVISGAEWFYRTWKLWRDETVRPFGSRSRWHFDFFHISYTLGYGIALVRSSFDLPSQYDKALNRMQTLIVTGNDTIARTHHRRRPELAYHPPLRPAHTQLHPLLRHPHPPLLPLRLPPLAGAL